MPSPIYTADNCRFAYQLNWSLSIFTTGALADATQWLEPLKAAVEADGVRILEHRLKDGRTHQFLLSTKPHVSPAQAIRSVKGRLQYLLRNQSPKALRRNYHIHSIGSATRDCIEQYVRSQCDHHRMADGRVQTRIEANQLHDPNNRLNLVRTSSHGQFIHNLHVVLVHREREHEIREEVLRMLHETLKRASATHEHVLPEAAILSDHIHITLGCGIDESPQEVALSYLNNLAYVLGMKPVYQYGGYLGTFGEYDLGAVRRALARQRPAV
jgi:REP element-mobilizing transposase RayT